MIKPRDLKYLIAYIIPASTFLAIQLSGVFSYLTVFIAFVLVPVFELFFGVETTNLSDKEISEKTNSVFFDVLLYLNIFFVYGMIIYCASSVATHEYTFFELLGLILSMGIMFGSNGINVAHELGHKSGFLPQTAAKLLLLPNLYMHFIIEHNWGHHLKVATLEDPATARFNEPIFSFWPRSVFGGFISAWNIEMNFIRKSGKKIWSVHNNIIRFVLYQLFYILCISLIFSPFAAVVLIASAFVGILLLESINYIEHYGLIRKRLPGGRYTPVEPIHSWNSDHEVGRVLLYELTRHSDHHYKASKKYQLLNHYDESPQLPFGYPTSILIALCPPLWFKLMNPKVEQWEKSF